MRKSVRILAFVGSSLFVLTLALFLVCIYPYKPLAKILLYHAVSDQKINPNSSVIYKGLFMRQMEYVSTHGYEPVFLTTVIQRYKEGKTIPSKWLVLSFDVEYEDFYSFVYPVLKRYNFKASIFIPVSTIRQGRVTWEQLQEMKNSGLVEVGSHSLTHRPLTCLPLTAAREEIVNSKALMEEKLGVPIFLFAYPFGAVNNQITEWVREAGYTGAVGIVYRWGEFTTNNMYNLNRVYVDKFSGYPFMFKFILSDYYVPTRALALRLLNIKVPRAVADCNEWRF